MWTHQDHSEKNLNDAETTVAFNIFCLPKNLLPGYTSIKTEPAYNTLTHIHVNVCIISMKLQVDVIHEYIQ